LQAEWPDQANRVTFVTGDALGATATTFLARVGRPVLEKPFTHASLIQIVA